MVLLQELHNGAYFCQHESVDEFDRAEPIPGPSTERLGALAKELGLVIVASLFERRAAGLYRKLSSQPEAGMRDPLTVMDWVDLYALAVNEENASGGTDHGSASVMFALGGAVNGGRIYGKWPGLKPGDLHAGDNVATYQGSGGTRVIHHKGYANVQAFLPRVQATWPRKPRGSRSSRRPWQRSATSRSACGGSSSSGTTS